MDTRASRPGTTMIRVGLADRIAKAIRARKNGVNSY
jgi:hypothetical protein